MTNSLIHLQEQSHPHDYSVSKCCSRQVASRIDRQVVLLVDDAVDSHVCTAAFSIRVATTASSNLPEFVHPGHMSVHYVQPKWAKLSSGAMNKSCMWFPCQQLQIYQKRNNKLFASFSKWAQSTRYILE